MKARKTATSTLLGATTRTLPASGRVFAITELLELILLEADTIQLFALQRVNSPFRDIIKTNKDLRKRMLHDESHRATLEEVTSMATDKRVQAAMYPLKIMEMKEDMWGMCVHVKLDQSFISTHLMRQLKPQLRLDTPSEKREASWRHIKFPASRGRALSYDLQSEGRFAYDRNTGNDWAGLVSYPGSLATFGNAVDAVLDELRVMLYNSWHWRR